MRIVTLIMQIEQKVFKNIPIFIYKLNFCDLFIIIELKSFY